MEPDQAFAQEGDGHDRQRLPLPCRINIGVLRACIIRPQIPPEPVDVPDASSLLDFDQDPLPATVFQAYRGREIQAQDQELGAVRICHLMRHFRRAELQRQHFLAQKGGKHEPGDLFIVKQILEHDVVDGVADAQRPGASCMKCSDPARACATEWLMSLGFAGGMSGPTGSADPASQPRCGKPRRSGRREGEGDEVG